VGGHRVEDCECACGGGGLVRRGGRRETFMGYGSGRGDKEKRR
jgi:hypothetical protein